MVSINTSSTGMASAALRSINAQLAVTQNRIATGYKVNSAADNATVWATATKIRADRSASENLKSSMSTAKAQADAASGALDQVSTLLQKIKDLATTAVNASGGATDADANQIGALITQARAIISGASINSKNLLGASTANDVSVTMNIVDGATTNLTTTLTAQDVVGSAGVLKDALKSSIAKADITATYATTTIDTAQTEIGKIAATLSGFSAGIESSMSFLDKLNDIRDSAVSGLVDADLEKESAKLNALQVKQQLAYQALAIGNSAQQNILRLFQ
ncbi:flagellin [Aureimonas endophytica]|uniref:Flagellin n=1 Tax=Aureimonas endophytica TaxID=2027858 RepID=A0A916ZRM4_9HYPH|nr:flagellin [Aureimonas endophytica]GGE08074.1 flagellin [Aureimonas endophytica]